MRIKSVLASLLGLLFSTYAFSQNGSYVSVNNYTGTPNVIIPLQTVTSGSLSMPVSAVYQGSGVKVKDIKGLAGMNWGVSAGGQVSREVRGLPDDIKADNLSSARLGWLYNTNGAKINSFTIANDNSSAVCTDEIADNAYINTNFSDLSDTEPDVFSVNAPGLSCQFVFDGNHNIKTIPYQDVKITYATNATTGKIISFTVVNNQGITYSFLQTEETTKKTVAPGAVSYFKRFYDQYANGITYSRAWRLTYMSDIQSGELQLSYTTTDAKRMTQPVSVVLPGASISTLQYSINETYYRQVVDQVFSGTLGAMMNVLKFTYSGFNISNIVGMGRKISFLYGAVPVQPKTDRSFLRTINISGGGIKNTFNFDYKGVTWALDATPGSVLLPDSTSKEIDYWGYYNAGGATSLVPQVYINPSNSAMERYRNMAPGSGASSYLYTISGASRDASVTGAINGSLTKITYEDGSTTSLDYELNSFYDNTAAAVVQGGGIRVKTITQYDGVTTANNIVTNYSYLNPAGVSSGKAISIPVYAFTTPYTGSGTDAAKWANSTIRSEDDLAKGDGSVVYSHVKISQSGIGNTLYEYSVPATNWDISALPDWAPTIIYSGRTACTTASFANNQTNNYPYPPNPNFDFEQGLLKKVSAFNETGQQVSEQTYTYQRSFASPTIITGFKFDNNTTARNYAKYSIYAGTSELIVSQSSKLFDLPVLTTYQTSTTNYNYASTAHKLPTSIETTNSDGSIVRNYIKYIKDYTTVVGADPMASSLYRLNQQNLNLPIEQYQQVQKGTDIRTTAASLTLYNNFSDFGSSDQPSQSLRFVAPDGVTDFQPSTIVSNTFTRDNRYVIKNNVLTYDAFRQPQSVDDNHNHIITTLREYNYGQPYALIKNAQVKEVAIDDFNRTYSPAAFTYTDTISSTNARSGLYAVIIKPTSVISRQINKGALAGNYIFSVWVNTNATSTITVKLTNSSSQNFSYVLSVPNTVNKWQYLELKVPVISMSPVFTVKLTPSVNTLIDDLLFYPDNAAVIASAYDITGYLKTSETNTNGVATYYGYDDYGRLKFIYDQDKNIVQKKTYVKSSSYDAFSADFTYSGPGNYNNPMTFVNEHQAELEGTTWTWDFGDGSPVVTTRVFVTSGLTQSQSNQMLHTYTHAGVFNVTLTKSSPFAGTKTVTKAVTITDHSSQPVPLSASIAPSYAVQLVSFTGTGAGATYDRSQIEFGGTTVPEGVYQVTVNTVGTLYNPSTGNGFKCVYVAVNNRIVDCRNYTSNSNVYTFTGIDLNGATSVVVSFSNQACSAILPPIEIQ
jgi:YD repeat-containing protein